MLFLSYPNKVAHTFEFCSDMHPAEVNPLIEVYFLLSSINISGEILVSVNHGCKPTGYMKLQHSFLPDYSGVHWNCPDNKKNEKLQKCLKQVGTIRCQ